MVAKRSAGKPSAPAGSTKAGRPDGPAADPRVAQIKHLIDVMVAAGAVEVEMEEAGRKLRVRLKEDRPLVAAPAAFTMQPAVAPQAAATGAGAPGASSEPRSAPAKPSEELDGEVFKSPMVGTFYAAPSPEAETFVKVGERVKAEQTLCIIEAMKVMNEIKAEKAVTVLKVLAQNGEPVEFGQPLFLVRA